MAFLPAPAPALRPHAPRLQPPRHPPPSPRLTPRLSTQQLSRSPVKRRRRPPPSAAPIHARPLSPLRAPSRTPSSPAPHVFFQPSRHPLPLAPTRPTPAKPVRKPHGYWNDLSNLERELSQVNADLGRPRLRSVPRLADMSALGRGDLVAAIGKHGGVKRVADALRWGRRGRVRRASASASASTSPSASTSASASAAHRYPTAPIRAKLLRRPAAYWNNVERVRCEIGAFIDEYGVRGVMPTRKQFYDVDRADLVQAAARHGGLTKMAKAMGLSCRRAARRKQYWKDFSVLEKALLDFARENCPGRMPTGDELMAKGCSAITNAVATHGGFPAVARRLGLTARNTKSQGAPRVWDEARLKMELHAFTIKYFPDLARTQTIPTERQLRKYGRNDLSYAVNKAGGYAAVAKALGLQQKRRGVFRSKKPGDGKRGDFAGKATDEGAK